MAEGHSCGVAKGSGQQTAVGRDTLAQTRAKRVCDSPVGCDLPDVGLDFVLEDRGHVYVWVRRFRS